VLKDRELNRIFNGRGTDKKLGKNSQEGASSLVLFFQI
jgi:hypothetical protein